MNRLVAIVALLACAAVLAACGDDEGDATPATTTATSGASGTTGSSGNDDAEDAKAKGAARSAQTAIETYATDHDGSYAGVSPNDLDQIEPVTSDIGVTSTADTYSITADSGSGNSFTVEREKDGTTKLTCTEAGVGGCDENGEW